MSIEPSASRPNMPGYGISEGAEGQLRWSWAQDRLESSHNYWLSTVRPDGRPHTMPLWAVLHEGRVYFSTARTSVKARNLAANPACTITNEQAHEAVIVEGTASIEDRPGILAPVWAAYKAKYEWDIDGEPMFVIEPRVAFSFIEEAERFEQAATRWTFA